LEEFGLWPDDYRSLIHPVPDNFQRISVKTEAAEDGTALRYTVVDKQVPLNISSNFRRIAQIRGSYWEGATAAKYSLDEIPGSVRSGAQIGVALGRNLGGLGTLAGALIGAGLGAIASPFAFTTFPTIRRGILVEVVGTP